MLDIRERMINVIEAVRHQRPAVQAGDIRGAFRAGGSEAKAKTATALATPMARRRDPVAKKARETRERMKKVARQTPGEKAAVKEQPAMKALGARSKALQMARKAKTQAGATRDPGVSAAMRAGVKAAVKTARAAHKELLKRTQKMSPAQKAEFKKSKEDPVGGPKRKAAEQRLARIRKKAGTPPPIPGAAERKRLQALTQREKAEKQAGRKSQLATVKKEISTLRQARKKTAAKKATAKKAVTKKKVVVKKTAVKKATKKKVTRRRSAK